MPNWNEILNEIRAAGSTYDLIRRKYLRHLHEVTGRNVIIYYSGWLQKGGLGRGRPELFGISDEDKNGLMSAIHKLDRSLGLDLVLHTPGGETAVVESIVDYLRSVFGTNIRAIIPQLAMSGGTMIACACKKVIMGKHSSLGPIDPQLGGCAAHGIIEEFKTAHEEIKMEPTKIHLWQPIIAKYSPTLIGECQKAIQWANNMVKEWLLSGMLAGTRDAEDVADNIIRELGDHAVNLSHARHISAQRAKDMGLDVVFLEEDDALQDAVLSVHHACMHTLASTPAVKIIENHEGVAWIKMAQEG